MNTQVSDGTDEQMSDGSAPPTRAGHQHSAMARVSDWISGLSISRKLVGAFGAVLLVFVTVGFVAFRGVNSLQDNEKWVTHTHEVIEATEETLLSLVEIETGMRGFAITGVEEFLEPYTAGNAMYDESFNRGRTLTLDNPAQTARWDRIDEQVELLMAETDRIIEVRRNGTLEDAAAALTEARGKALMDATRGIIAEILAEEQALLEERAAASDSSSASIKLVIILGVLLACAVVAGAAYFLSRSIA